MRRVLVTVLALAALVLLALLVVPFLIPVPPLQGAVPAEELADPDSRFVDVDGLRMHYKLQGQGEPALLLLHGFAGSTFSWREVMPPLSALGETVAFDRPAFGLTQRPMPGEWQGQNPYSLEAQADQTVALMDRLGIDRAVLVGNSAGGTVAVLTALRHPERVEALVLVSPAIYSGGGAPPWLRPVLKTPQAGRLGPLFSRAIESWGDRLIEMAWHDPAKVTAEVLAGYHRPLKVENWDRALWELTKASTSLGLDRRLGELRLPVLVIAGDDDRIVPTAESIRLARELPGAELAVIPDCGHVPQEECPQAFLSAVGPFLSRLAAGPAPEQ